MGEPQQERRWQALLVADLVESVRLLQQHEAAVVPRWRALVEQVAAELLLRHGGRLVKSLGDGLLLRFDDAPAALALAQALHQAAAAQSRGLDPEARLLLRVGLHVGAVIDAGFDLLGHEVNLCVRLAALAAPGGCVLSEAFVQALPEPRPALQDLGPSYLKHVQAPVRAFRLGGDGAALPPAELRPRLLVLPVQALRAELQPWSLVLTDDLVHALSRQGRWQVLSRLSTQARAAAGVADLLGASHLLRCRLGGRAGRVEVELDLEQDHGLVWSGQFELAEAELLHSGAALAARLAERVSSALLRRRYPGPHHSALPNQPAYALLLRAMDLLHRLGEPELEQAQAILDHLAERHPRSADVQAWLAKWHFLSVAQMRVERREDAVARARDRLQRALELDAQQGQALALRGHLLAFEERDTDGALRELEHAAGLAGNEPLVWLFLANLQAMRGEPRALDSLRTARELSPLDPLAYLVELLTAIVEYAVGSVERSLVHAERSVALNPLHLSSWVQLIVSQADCGRVDAARASARHYLSLRPQASVAHFVAHHVGRDAPLVQRQAEALLAAGMPP